MSKYTELDAKIIQSIARKKNTFIQISGAVRELSYALAEWTGQESFRIVDRRLQALRKAGKIVFSNKQWAIKFKDEEL